MLAVLPPGVVWGGGLGRLECLIEVFGLDDFGLAGELFEGGEGQGLVFVEDGDFSFGIFANGDLGIAQGVIWTVGLDLVDDLVTLNGQVFGEEAGVLAGKAQLQVFGWEQRAVGILGAAWGYGETAVEIFTKRRQESIGGFEGGEVSQAQLLDQAVLQGLVGAFHPALGLRGVGADDLNVQCLHGAPKLGEALPSTNALGVLTWKTPCLSL